jgi:hypothetical protein
MPNPVIPVTVPITAPIATPSVTPVVGPAPARPPGFNAGGEVSEIAPEAVAPTSAVEAHAKGGAVGDTKPRYKGVIHKGG